MMKQALSILVICALMLSAALKQPGRAEACLHAIHEIATGAGVTGMIAGQVIDLYCEHNRVGDVEALEYIQHGIAPSRAQVIGKQARLRLQLL